MADAADSKSATLKVCGFKSRLRHHFFAQQNVRVLSSPYPAVPGDFSKIFSGIFCAGKLFLTGYVGLVFLWNKINNNIAR